MRTGWRRAVAGVAVGLGVVSVTSCSVIGIEQPEPLACEGETPPNSAPGDAHPLLTIAEGESPFDLVTVIYADGVVVQAEGGSTVTDPAATPSSGDSGSEGPGGEDEPGTPAGPWRTGYLLPCAVAELRDRAENALFGSPEFGRVDRPDLDWTYLSYDNGASTASVEVHGHDAGYSDGLSWSERRARDALREVTDLLRVNIVSVGDPVPVAAVQLDGEMPEGATLRSTWPGPPAAELLGEAGCGVMTEEVAQEAYRYGRDRGLGDAGEGLTLRVLPPGVAGC